LAETIINSHNITNFVTTPPRMAPVIPSEAEGSPKHHHKSHRAGAFKNFYCKFC